ncbi:MAG: hypothetical protein MUC38_04530 [Cyclobacteriaceae bacterium]|nr:hypothetical protein [Cyclobacteriaceae bacterium]
MKKTAKTLFFAWLITMGFSCSDETFVELKDEESISLHLLRNSEAFNGLLRRSETNMFLRTYVGHDDKKRYLLEYLSPILDEQGKKIASDISEEILQIGTKLSGNQRTHENGISVAVSGLTERLKSDMENGLQISSDFSEGPDEVIARMKGVIQEFRTRVTNEPTLTQEEQMALISFADFEDHSMVDLVYATYDLESQSAGKGKRWFKKLVSAFVTAVVAAVVVVAVVVTGGAAAVAAGAYISAAAWGTMIAVGAIVGGVYGGAVGYDLASRGYYFTDFNPSNIGGGFLEWEQCLTNPGHWACI